MSSESSPVLHSPKPSPPSYDYKQLGAAAEMIEPLNESSQDTTKSLITDPPKESIGSVEPGADSNDAIRMQDILELLAQMDANHTANLRAIQDNFASQQKQFSEAMQQQQSANKNMQEQLKKVQEQRRVASSGKTLGGEGGGAGGLESQFPFNPSFTSGSEAKLGGSITQPPPSQPSPTQPPPTHPPPSTGNAVDRLAAVLERQLSAPKQSTRLPSLTLPKLIQSSNQIVGTNFFSFKKRCLQLFAEHNVGESIAVHLLQTEDSLPKRFRESLNNCSTIKGCFQTMESMTEPLTAVYPQLLKELCSVESAFDNAAQIELCDNVCRILLQMFEHYPGEDIQITHVTAVISAFSSEHDINTLPGVVASFQHKQSTTHKKFSTLLYDHCIQRRTDLYSIMAALQMWRKDDSIY